MSMSFYDADYKLVDSVGDSNVRQLKGFWWFYFLLPIQRVRANMDRVVSLDGWVMLR